MDLKPIIDKWQTILAAVVMIASTAVAVDARYAKDIEVAALSQGFEQYKAEDQRDKLQQRIWDVQDRASLPDLTKREREDLQKRQRELEQMKQKLDKRIDELGKENK